MFDLTGMTALGTGATGGIGSAIAKALATQGATLALSGTSEEKLAAFMAELGGDHAILPCNLSDAAAVDALVPQAVETLDQLDILDNNPGVTRDNPDWRLKADEGVQVYSITIESAFRLVRAKRKPQL